MLTPAEEAALRDRWTIDLLERTSDPAALTRARREEREGVPVYDEAGRVDFGRRVGLIQPRDQTRTCECCGLLYVSRAALQRFCSRRCRLRYSRPRLRPAAFSPRRAVA